MTVHECSIARWRAAGLLDEATAERIREYERNHPLRAEEGWHTGVALTLGAILLGAGLLLFVAAHWDRVSPMGRFAFVLGVLASLHLCGALLRDRSAKLATTLHAIGTVALGGAIALTGQIFNVASHWPAAVLLWALGALAGWWLLQDGVQPIFASLLLPAWLVCELANRLSPYQGVGVYVTRVLLVLAAVYLTAFLREGRPALRGWLFAAGAVALPLATIYLLNGWREGWRPRTWGFVPWGWRAAALLLMLALLIAAYLRLRASAPVVLGALVVGYLLPWTVRPVLHPAVAIGRGTPRGGLACQPMRCWPPPRSCWLAGRCASAQGLW